MASTPLNASQRTAGDPAVGRGSAGECRPAFCRVSPVGRNGLPLVDGPPRGSPRPRRSFARAAGSGARSWDADDVQSAAEPVEGEVAERGARQVGDLAICPDGGGIHSYIMQGWVSRAGRALSPFGCGRRSRPFCSLVRGRPRLCSAHECAARSDLDARFLYRRLTSFCVGHIALLSHRTYVRHTASRKLRTDSRRDVSMHRNNPVPRTPSPGSHATAGGTPACLRR
jgi:hypothetical protein